MAFTSKKGFKKKVMRKTLFKRGMKKRYRTTFKGKQAYNIGAIYKDITFLKSQLNAEHKHIDTTFGTGGPVTYVTQFPYRDAPIIQPLSLPSHGLYNNNRVGNQVVFTNITCKYGILFANTTDRRSRSTIRARIIWAKSADDVPLIANLLMADPNDEYTEMSYVNEQEYRKYIWTKSLDVTQSHQEQTRYNGSSSSVGSPLAPNQYSRYYPRASWKGRIRTEFETGTSTCTVNKPYILLTSNAYKDPLETYAEDPISFQGTIRLTYIDN